MSDILISWNPAIAAGDWSFENGDLSIATGTDELSTSVLASIFSDAAASPDYVPSDGTNDRRGWWGSTFQSLPLGSQLWQLFRSKITSNTGPLLQAQSAVSTSLQYLQDQGIATNINVSAAWVPGNPQAMSINVKMAQPTTNITSGPTYQNVWASPTATASVTTITSPPIVTPPPSTPLLDISFILDQSLLA